MVTYTLQEVARICHGELLRSEDQFIQIQGVSTDTRTIAPGNLFIPLIGIRFDGHAFVSRCIQSGAAASLWQKDKTLPDDSLPLVLVDDTLTAMHKLAGNYRESLNIRVIGITGSNGKTTTKDITASILSEKYKVQKTPKNFNNLIGLPKTIFSLEEDTDLVVLEMGTERFGEISCLTNVAEPDFAVITNIGDCHLLELGTKENIARAKFEILEGLKPDGIFLYNGDDEILRKVIKEYDIPQTHYSFGLGPDNDFIIEPIKYDETGNTFSLNGHIYTVPLLGEHQMYNGAVGIIIAEFYGFDYTDIAKGLTHIELTGMRNSLIRANGFDILDDSYKSNPQSLNACLQVVYNLDHYDQKIVIIGDMLALGEKELEIHKNIGQSLNPNKIDYVLSIGELSKALSEEAEKLFPLDRVFHFNDKSSLIEKAKELITPKTLVMVKASRALQLEDIVRELAKYNLTE